MKYLGYLFVCIALFKALEVNAQLTEKNYKIYSVKLSKEVAINDIIEDMKSYKFYFMGKSITIL